MKITSNTIVTLSCQLLDTQGNIIDEGIEPLIYLHGGYGQIFKPLENELEGKKIGDTFSITIKAVDGFGEYDDALKVLESLDELPEELEIGMELDGYLDESPEDTIIYTVTHIDDTHATLDANHPLAGKDLVFTGSVSDIIPATEEMIDEILHHSH